MYVPACGLEFTAKKRFFSLMLPLVFETHRQEQEHETSRKVESEWVSE
jgi:hypothetical protein